MIAKLKRIAKDRKLIYLIPVILICILAGCTHKNQEDKSSAEGTDRQSTESDTESGTVLKFVDAHGNPYETTIREDFTKHSYQWEYLSADGQKVKYEGDGKYRSRLGVDVSYHQGDIDWQAVKADGYEFAIIRAGYRGYGQEGTLNVDDKFIQNLEGAQAAGLDVGVYFFSQAVSEDEAKEEAEYLLEQLKGYELQCPVVYDPEKVPDVGARTDNVTGEQFTKNSRAFLETIEKNGYKGMLYSNMLFEAFELDLAQLSDYPVWYADYEAKPQTPYQFTYWQYSESGTVNGISGAVDLDIQFIPVSD